MQTKQGDCAECITGTHRIREMIDELIAQEPLCELMDSNIQIDL